MLINHRITLDNPFREVEEWRCCGCGEWFSTDDIVFIDKQGKATVMFGDPYCVHCRPQQQTEDYD